jgi:hypothetical protein
MNNAMTPAALETLVAQIAVVARGYSISVEVGPRYARIAKCDGGTNRSAYGFVDMSTGDLLKAASFRSPAKGARGNALTGDLACLGRFGIAKA